MRRSTSRWIVGIATGGIVHIGIFWAIVFLDSQPETLTPQREDKANIVYVGPDTDDLSPIMRQQIELFDPKPLMQPTEWNTSNFDRVEAYYVEEDLQIFVDYEPIYESEDGDFVTTFGNAWTPADAPAQTALSFPVDATRGVGRVSLKLSSDFEEGVALEVIRMGSGETVFQNTYYNNAALEILGIPGDWGIASFTVLVVDSFLAGLPSIEESSGNPETDRRISELTVRKLLPKGLLDSGAYRVRIAR